MHPISRKLFLSQSVLALAGCRSKTAEAMPAPKGPVPIAYMARLYSMGATLSGKKVVLKNRYNTLEVETDSRRAWINGTMIWLHHPCRKSGGHWTIHEIDFRKGIDPILRAYAHVPTKLPQVVVLDPGHGGKDPGAIGPAKVAEKTVVLDIAFRVKARIEAQRIKVLMTRTSDTYLGLDPRNAFAARAGADLFVSIHADGAADPAAHGVETFIMTAAGFDSSNHYGQAGDKTHRPGNLFDAANAVLGFSIQNNLVKASGRADRGLRRSRFSVLRNASSPAALVECGFLTNPAEEALLNTAGYRDQVAQGIANGILGYCTLVKRARK